MPHSPIKDFYYSIFPDNSKYLTFEEGETNIILSAPHGGGIKPRDIPKRTRGNRSQDTYTRRLIQRLIELFYNKPYYIYADIHRSRVDLNRSINEATQGNEKAKMVWKDWNKALELYTDIVRSDFRGGLYVDIHSHNNGNKFQIGYGLDVKSYLNCMYNLPIQKKSTLYSLKRRGRSEYETLFGNGSFVHLLNSHGFSVLVPESESTYLNGGRNIKQFSGNGIGAIQIECPITVLMDELESVAQILYYSIVQFKDRFM